MQRLHSFFLDLQDEPVFIKDITFQTKTSKNLSYVLLHLSIVRFNRKKMVVLSTTDRLVPVLKAR